MSRSRRCSSDDRVGDELPTSPRACCSSALDADEVVDDATRLEREHRAGDARGSSNRAQRCARLGDLVVDSVADRRRDREHLRSSRGFEPIVGGVEPRFVARYYLRPARVPSSLLVRAVRRRRPTADVQQTTSVDMPIPLPPLEEQRAIADYLDRETARIDTLIEEQQRLIEMLRERRAGRHRRGASATCVRTSRLRRVH